MNSELKNSRNDNFWQDSAVSQDDLLKTDGTLQKVMFWDGASSKKFSEVIYKSDLKTENANLELLLIYVGRGDSELKLRLDVRHLSRLTRSRITLKALLFDQSKLDFVGNVYVPNNAPQTDTFLRCDSLLLSKSARARTTPAMEIIANDVKAGHAASIGEIDADLLFYLATRGFPPEQAKKVLIDAFLLQSLKTFSDLGQSRTDLLEKKLMHISENIVL